MSRFWRKILLKIISKKQVNALCQQVRPLKGSESRPQVLLRSDNLVVKFIYKHRKLSNRLFPYVKRMAKQSMQLRKRGVLCVDVQAVYRCPALKCDIVTYPYLAGENILDLLNAVDDPRCLLDALVDYLLALHQQGVYFHDLHFKNILQLEPGKFGLIDIDSVILYNKPLSIKKRVINMAHLVSDEPSFQFLYGFGVQKFLKIYEGASDFSDTDKKQWRRELINVLPFLALVNDEGCAKAVEGE